MTYPKQTLTRMAMLPSVAALLGALGTTTVHAQTSLASAPLYGCVLRNGDEGKFRIVSATQSCKKDETRIQWNTAGSKGLTGNTGPVGPSGPAGPAGPGGAVGLLGPAGSAGPRGPTGTTGAAGAAGSAGSVGAAGLAGSAGAAGTAGAAGVAGPTGPAGAKGLSGDAGPVGSAGSTGPSGLAGSSGVAGLRGDQGPTGIAGPQGSQGLQGVSTQGPKGPTGDASTVAGPAGALAPSGSIRGSVTTCNAQGAAITAPAGTLVYIPGRAFTAATDNAGAFQFDYVPAGTYSVAVETGGKTIVTNSNNVAVASAGVNLGTIAACAPVTPPGGGGTSACGVCTDPTPICNIWQAPFNQCVMCVNNNECTDPLASECIGNSCEGLGF